MTSFDEEALLLKPIHGQGNGYIDAGFDYDDRGTLQHVMIAEPSQVEVGPGKILLGMHKKIFSTACSKGTAYGPRVGY